MRVALAAHRSSIKVIGKFGQAQFLERVQGPRDLSAGEMMAELKVKSDGNAGG